MPADGFDAAAKKSGPRHVPLAAPKRAMGGTYISGKDVGRGMAVTMSRYTATIRGQAEVAQTSSSRRDWTQLRHADGQATCPINQTMVARTPALKRGVGRPSRVHFRPMTIDCPATSG